MANLFRGERFDNSRQGNVKQDSQNISELNLIRKEMAGHISLMTVHQKITFHWSSKWSYF